MSGRRNRYRVDEIPTLYVRQVHYSARPDDLRALFERMGPVRDVYIPLDYYTRESRGFAYVKFEFTRDAEDALRELNGASILGRRIEVEWAEGQRKTKTEMRARDSYNSYRVRDRYRSRSPYKSRREFSPRRRSRSKRHSHSRSKRRPQNSRRHRSNSRHYQSSTRSRDSRSISIRKSHEKDRKTKRSKSPFISFLHSIDENKNPSDKEQDNDLNISNQKIAEKLKEPVANELEIRNEARASDIEIDEKQIRKAIQKKGNVGYLEDHIGMENDRSSASTTEEDEEEEDKTITDIEVIDEITEQNGTIFSDNIVGAHCLSNNISTQELLITETTS